MLEQQISRKSMTRLCLWEEKMSPIARCDIYICLERIIAFTHSSSDQSRYMSSSTILM